MKTINYITASAILFLAFNSCQKSVDNSKVFASIITAQDAGIIQPKICFVQHTEDDLFYMPMDFIYNAHERLDSINFSGTPITLKYDSKRRLTKANFGTYAWFDFSYIGNALWPVTLEYYYPAFGNLLAIDSFTYNKAGQITKRTVINIQSPMYNFFERYFYNTGNVIKVNIGASNGGKVYKPGYTELTASKYDTRPDFISQNPWIKYVFFHSGIDLSPYLWGSFSVNNLSDFTWTFDPSSDPNSATSTFYYDNQGFANDVISDWYDPVTSEDLGIYTRSSYSTCDILSLNHLNKPLANSSPLQQIIKGMNRNLPLTVTAK